MPPLKRIHLCPILAFVPQKIANMIVQRYTVVTKKFFFPVVHPPRKHGAGYAEVFVCSDRSASLPPENHFPHQRFFLDRVIRAWEMLEQPCLWPDTVLGWSPHSVDEETCSSQRWQGPSANLATLLAVAHHCHPFHHNRLQTQQIWATGCLSPQGVLEAANQFATKAQFFLEYGKQTGVHGIFIAPLEHQPVLAHPQQHDLEHIPYRVQIFDPQLKTVCTQEAPVFLLLPQQSTSVAQFLRWAQGNSARTKQVLYASASLFCFFLLAWLWSHSSMVAKTSGTQKANMSSYSQHTSDPNQRLSLTAAEDSMILAKLSPSRPKPRDTPFHSSAPVDSSPSHTSSASVLPKTTYPPMSPLPRTDRTVLRKQRKWQRHRPPRRRSRVHTRSTKSRSSAVSSNSPTQETPGIPSSSPAPRIQPIPHHNRVVTPHCSVQEIQVEVHPSTAIAVGEPSNSFTKPTMGVFCFPAKTQRIAIQSQDMRECVLHLSSSPNHSRRRYQAVLQRDSPHQSSIVHLDYCIHPQPPVQQ